MGTELPPYRIDLAPFLGLPDDLSQKYTNIRTQVFPLRAQMSALSTFCDAYLNVDSYLPVYFRPAAPLVVLEVADYGDITINTPYSGLFSQREVSFGFPLEWYDKIGSDLVFRDWAMIYPFIFVDDPLSLSGGRELYGWSKASIEIECPTLNLDPTAARSVVRVGQRVYDEKRLEIRGRGPQATILQPNPDDTGTLETLLEVCQQRPFLSGQSGIGNALGSLSQIAGGYLALISGVSDAVSVVTDTMSKVVSRSDNLESAQMQRLLFGSFRATSRVPQQLAGLYNRVARGSSQSGVSQVNIITLKQFRDPHNFDTTAYHAIVGSTMTIDRIIDAGLLFDPLSPDPTGGIEITLHQRPLYGFNIKDDLGLNVLDECAEGPDGRLYHLRPVMPLWSKMDLSYGAANFQCWQANGTGWSITDAPAPPPPPTIVPVTPPIVLPVLPGRYNLRGSGAGLELGGSRFYKPISSRVFIFKVDRDKLQNLVTSYFQNKDYEFQVFPSGPHMPAISPYVAIMAEKFTVYFESSPTHAFQDHAISLAVPVQFRQYGSPTWLYAMLPLYNFVATDWDYITENEMYGRLTLRSEIASPPSAWLDLTSPSSTKGEPATALRLRTELYDDKGQTPKIDTRTLMEIHIEHAPNPPGPYRASSWDTIRRVSRALGLGSFVQKRMKLPISIYNIALRQVRDAKKPGRASYMALVGTKRTILELEHLEHLDGVTISINNYKGLPIVETLGLGKKTNGESVELKPDHSMALAGAMTDDRAEILTWRAGTGDWTPNPNFQPFAPVGKKLCS